MSWEPIGFWGCDSSGYMDLWNNQRTLAYVLKHSPQSIKFNPSAFPDISSYITSDGPPISVPSLTTFTDPVSDNAWWFDTARAESGGFLGMIVTKVTGIESNTLQQDNDVLLDNNGTFSYHKPINKGYTITVEAVLMGLSCCSVSYGLRRIRKALTGCCANGCRGTRLRMLGCLPGTVSAAGNWIPPDQSAISPWRSLFNVKLLEQPSIVDGSGIACGACGCNPITRVTFTLKSQGELYKDPVTLLFQQALQGGDCTLGCSPTCATIPDLVHDPSASIGPLPTAPNATLSVPPPIVSQQWRIIDFQSVGFDSEMEVQIYAGATLPLYGVTVKAWPYNPSIAASTGLYNDCNVCAGFAVPYIPAGATWYRKVCSGLYVSKIPYTQDARGSMLDTLWQTPNPVMRFGSNKYLLSIETDTSAGTDAWITLTGRTIEP